jgi:acyl dehydratase
MGIITDEARAWADRSYPSYEYPVLARDILKYAQAIGETDPIHLDRAAAHAAGFRDIVAPPLFPYVIRLHAASLQGLEADGSPSEDVPPLPTTGAMAGETAMRLGVPVHAGDVITVDKELVEMYEKEGRSGALVFVKHRFTFRNQADEMVMVEEFTRIYR